MRIGIIGAGHAGVEAAKTITDKGGEVVLYSDESVLPYIRPRVVLLAFGRVQLDGIAIRPQRWYSDRKIDLRLGCPVTQIDARTKTVTADGHQERFDALILATGAGPVLLPFVQGLPDDVIPIWRAKDSLTLQQRLKSIRRLTILGAGISGLEAAAYSREAGIEVTIIEKSAHVMALQFGPTAAGVLANRLRNQGVDLRTGRFVTDVSKSEGELKMILDDGKEIRSDLVLTTVGAVRNTTVFAQAGLRTDKGVLVDEHQRTSEPGVFACGDIAQRDHIRTASIVLAAEQGRAAAINAMATLAGGPLTPVADRAIPLSFKHDRVEFHSIGVPSGPGLAEKVLSDDGQGIYRSVVLEGDLLRGVQMVGSREGFRQLADCLGQQYAGS
ncbi:MAG: FAD-dependent oxidoreductase [Phycisphaerae bacterium]|nr:FAD-dependent oxidoreductase [Phycisphaerae bacterium]